MISVLGEGSGHDLKSSEHQKESKEEESHRSRADQMVRQPMEFGTLGVQEPQELRGKQNLVGAKPDLRQLFAWIWKAVLGFHWRSSLWCVVLSWTSMPVFRS